MFNEQKNKRRYKATIEEVAGENVLSFESESHDDMIAIVSKLKLHPDFDANDAATLGVGLKLFSSIILKHKTNPMFKEFIPHLKKIIVRLKEIGR